MDLGINGKIALKTAASRGLGLGTHKTSRIDQLVQDRAKREDKPGDEISHEMMAAITAAFFEGSSN